MASAQPLAQLEVRFIDSATGYAVQPESVTARAAQPGASEQRVEAGLMGKSGRAFIPLARGRHTLTVGAPEHQPLSGEVEVTESNAYSIHFLLDPLVPPRELQPDYIGSLHREGATVMLGFVVDDDTGEPIAGAHVSSAPSGVQSWTDARGYFELPVPAQPDTEVETAPAHLLFEQRGYQTQDRQYLELWSNGDWTYRIRLTRGKGTQAIDERQFRHRIAKTHAIVPSASSAQTLEPVQPMDFQPKATSPTNSSIRVPRNIRVLKSDGVTIDYVTMDYYVKHVLPAEWISSWGSIAGGSNSLNAGAVAIRCYAIAKLNAAGSTSTYDICATTSCQVYGSTTSANTDTAVNYTANYVVLSSGTIPSTEYSAEDNSTGFSCGDGYTQPTGGCTFDPVCAGETRSGHGRGMCQWGTAKWATGRKMPGESSSNTTPNGYPLQDWTWIVQHYYPSYALVKGAVLVIGDDVKAVGTVNVNMCPDGGITNGVNCTLLGTVASGTTGTIVDGPMQITADGKGFTWYKIQWNDAGSTLGWAKENYLERVFSVPTAPTGLLATAFATNQINLSWSDTANVETGFKVERASSPAGPWMQVGTVGQNATSYSDKNLYPGSTWYYRVRAYNAGGNSGYSNTTNATTPNTAVTLPATGNKTITECTLLTITNTAAGADFVQLLTGLENFTTETTNNLPLFRNPRFSSTTSANLNGTPDLTIVTDAYTTTGHGTGRVLRVNCNFTNLSNPWLRLTTASAPSWPNPVIDFTRKLRFDIYADKAVQVAVGCRETTTAAGTPIGSDGGTSGAIEWAGVTNISGAAPMPTRTVAAGTWTTLLFNFPTESITSFSGGNGVLSTASGLGALEHLAIVPAAGIGAYNLYLDNFAVLTPRTFTYSLAAGAPSGASVNTTNGVFTWTPNESQGPGVYPISVVVTDNSSPPLAATNTFTVTVNESNRPPALAAIASAMVYAGATVTFTNSATDPDLPANTLTYSLDPGAPSGAGVNPTNGLFTWPTADAQAGTTNPIAVRVTDNGSPPLSDAKSFTITVLPRPSFQALSVSGSTLTLSWSAISNTTFRVQYKDGLLDAGWQTLGPDITAANSTVTAVDTGFGTVPMRFYRLLIVY